MKIAVFNPSSGISGNMILGALLDNGLVLEDLLRELGTLNLSGWEIVVSKVTRGGLSGTHVEVLVPHEHKHRHLSDIAAIINSSTLNPWVKARALRAFELLASAEAAAHGIGKEEVHFHEVGAMDAIIDIVGSCIGFFRLGIEAVYSTAIAVGSGTVECAHGILPLPAPATAHLLQGLMVIPTDVPFELATPTGVAILSSLVDMGEEPPPYVITSVGMGAGSRENRSRANLLRLIIGKATSKESDSECLRIETLIDDLDPRIWPVLNKKILEAGALDCYARTCLGKKGRQALELVVLTTEEFKELILSVVFKHSSTIGLRIATVERIVLKREFKKVNTAFGEVTVKLGFYKEKLVSAEPEFDECVSLADRVSAPVKIILQEARGIALKLFS